MFHAAGRLPHVLPTSAYHAPEAWAAEVSGVFQDSWHLVATTSELRRSGSFVTVPLLGRSLHIRNQAGQLQALSNTCLHRHCLIRSERRGHADKLRCQYHGWEYDAEGRAARIPEPKNFAPFEGPRLQLQPFRVETCGQLVFVCLSPTAPSLSEFLGPLAEWMQPRTGADYEVIFATERDYPCNWKIAVENTLEAYHVPAVHPQSFKEDPGESRSEHVLESRYTSFRTNLPFADALSDASFLWWQRQILRWIGAPVTGEYRHHHAFPHVLFSHTDSGVVCHCIIPTGPTTSRGIIRMLGRVGTSPWFWKRWPARGWGHIEAAVANWILKEDLTMYQPIQAGYESSRVPGMLGRCEERLHRFQQFIADHCGPAGAHHSPQTTGPSFDTAGCNSEQSVTSQPGCGDAN